MTNPYRHDEIKFKLAYTKQKIVEQRKKLVKAIISEDEELKKIERQTLELLRRQLKAWEEHDQRNVA